MSERPFNVLFLCTGNSARSIIAEAILNKLGHGRFHAYSAGSQPKGEVNPNTLALLRALDYDTSAFRSKPWSEFARPGVGSKSVSSLFSRKPRLGTTIPLPPICSIVKV